MSTVKGQMSLSIAWLYPDLMSTYGDRGNIFVLKRRCQWRNIEAKVVSIKPKSSSQLLAGCDVVVGGGAQDRQQEIVVSDLRDKKDTLLALFQKGVPGLFVCGAPQLLGHYYQTGEGERLEGLSIFDYVTRHFGNDKPRCIGNTAGVLTKKAGSKVKYRRQTIVGFENHGGRTYLGDNCSPFAKVIYGYGNNGEDGYEGAIYKNVIACYYHGPMLSKNPHIADFLIKSALVAKYKDEISLISLDDGLEWKAHDEILQMLNTGYDQKIV